MRSRWILGVLAALLVFLAGRAATMAQRWPAPSPLGIAQAEPKAGINRMKWRQPDKADDAPAPGDPVPPTGADPSATAPDGPRPGPTGGFDAEDPMGAVDAFLRRNRQEADDSIQALTREAETLRARLQKVEAALGRWQAVAGALHSEEKAARPVDRVEPAPQLESIPAPLPEAAPDTKPLPPPQGPPTAPPPAISATSPGPELLGTPIPK